VSNTYRNRQFTIQTLFVLSALLLIYKALEVQVLDDSFRAKADATTIGKYVEYPSRGLIYDRNGKLLVYNDLTYDLMATYNQINPDMDTSKFCALLDISEDYFEKALDKNWRSLRYSKSVPFIFLSKIPASSFNRFQESLYEFPGFTPIMRNSRGYPHENAAHVLGYIREVNQREVKNEDKDYALGDYIGASGLEKAYEDSLKGQKGLRLILKDNMGREVDEVDGENAIPPTSGKDLKATIDLDLQAYAESLMQNKIGSIVAIEPKTGEILTMLSTPSYNPNQLKISKERGKAYIELDTNPNKPFLDRSIMAQYPPGSLFKPFVALIAMQEGLLNPNRTIRCQGAYYLGGERLTGCHAHPTCFDVATGIQHSCNTYFVTIFRDIIDQTASPIEGLNKFNTYLDRFGMNKRLGLDFPNEKAGNYPSSEYYNDWFNRQQEGQKWKSLWIRSLAIGQGELLTTNLQLANMAAILANRGYYKTPHLVSGTIERDGTIQKFDKFQKTIDVGIDAIHFPPIIDGMERVVTAGTARGAYTPSISICGKTGTAENNQRDGKDHSIFFAFAPKDDPQIAIAVYIENGGWGGTYAAPIASLVIEKYINGNVQPGRKYLEDRMKKANLLIEKP
jgi:penicillin-binding protein 2